MVHSDISIERDRVSIVEEHRRKFDLDAFFESVASAEKSGLFLDFDGTLAPFRIDPGAARPWAGVPELLDRIQQAGRTRVAIVSGRPASDVAKLISQGTGKVHGMHRAPEIWGLHGAERLEADGSLEREELDLNQTALLEEARNAVYGAGFKSMSGFRVEQKWNAVALHWRGSSQVKARARRDATFRLLEPFAKNERMSLLEFDGGLELRAGRNKGDAVDLLLKELPGDAPVAYLGDDTTDEDAFVALRQRGLGVLVRRAWRPTAAQLWLRPPQQLREFLRSWIGAQR